MKTVKGRRRTGTLYRRWKGKKYPPDDPAAKDKGSIYLKYKVGGKTIVTRLGTSNLAEARKLITALAGLVTAASPEIGDHHARSLRDGLRSVQLAFREASTFPDPIGQGPGEKYTGPVN